MIETMRRDGHTALVHTAAASGLGRMLNRVCLRDGIGLVNVVRRPEQAALLRSEGAEHVCDTSAVDFEDTLARGLEATGATLVFDAIGGGDLVSRILAAMEALAVRKEPAFSPYGSSVLKQAYIYGALDPAPTELRRTFGLSWSVGGWLLTPFLRSLGQDRLLAFRERIAAEIDSTFASEHAGELSLEQAIEPETIRTYARKATGAKYLINPNKGLAGFGELDALA
jgi:hypothetical protein